MSSSTSTSNGPLVVVTGAAGYVAGPIIALLISKHYTVRGTVRSLTDDKAVQLQRDFPSLQLFQADLLQQGSFAEAIEGCKFVIHSASPFQRTWTDPQKDFIEPAVNGTANVIHSALSTPTVERIVVTSSCAAVLDYTKPAGTVFTDKDWSTTTSVSTSPYAHSKVLAERKAWELVEQHNAKHAERQVRLVVINPSVVLGPPVGSRVDGVSVSTIVNLLNESQVESGVVPMLIPDVDVRDVAKAHVAALEVPSANGRYILSSTDAVTQLKYAEILQGLYPRRYPTKTKAPVTMPALCMDNTRTVKELGVDFIPREQSIKDMAEKLIQWG